MKRCAACRQMRHAKEQQPAEWSWQPFGPDSGDTFTIPGWHYRGFPVVPICDDHRHDITHAVSVSFQFRGRVYGFKRSLLTTTQAPELLSNF